MIGDAQTPFIPILVIVVGFFLCILGFGFCVLRRKRKRPFSYMEILPAFRLGRSDLEAAGAAAGSHPAPPAAPLPPGGVAQTASTASLQLEVHQEIRASMQELLDMAPPDQLGKGRDATARAGYNRLRLQDVWRISS